MEFSESCSVCPVTVFYYSLIILLLLLHWENSEVLAIRVIWEWVKNNLEIKQLIK